MIRTLIGGNSLYQHAWLGDWLWNGRGHDLASEEGGHGGGNDGGFEKHFEYLDVEIES